MTDFCKGVIRGDFHRGDPCRFKAGASGFCSRHDPATLLPKAKLKVERLKRELRAAREDVYQLRNFHA